LISIHPRRCRDWVWLSGKREGKRHEEIMKEKRKKKKVI